MDEIEKITKEKLELQEIVNSLTKETEELKGTTAKRNCKDTSLAAERLKREKWEKEREKQIKEETVK